MESFWSTEYGQNLLSVEQTEIDKLLSNQDTTTLEDLFDEDELLQQCSNKNTQLINFLSRRDNITKLVSYITRPWQEHMQQIINHLKDLEEIKTMMMMMMIQTIPQTHQLLIQQTQPIQIINHHHLYLKMAQINFQN